MTFRSFSIPANPIFLFFMCDWCHRESSKWIENRLKWTSQIGMWAFASQKNRYSVCGQIENEQFYPCTVARRYRFYFLGSSFSLWFRQCSMFTYSMACQVSATIPHVFSKRKVMHIQSISGTRSVPHLHLFSWICWLQYLTGAGESLGPR